ncbi:hypothetical protein FB45DRAFT_168609 [Roridomyces roridus]|uniref:DUF6534 domain-containing protein n=1 Tax=Roridomyces roridus TaxID=1738132 RepID=A0AAD7BDZ1_9AGAR|nr:hypothetical protein FB45DRAFT_168609 [Roridomyces roridus]
MAINPLAGTYGVWLVSLFVETFLYGIGFLQVWAYFAHLPTDPPYIKTTVLGVLFLETVQVIFFFYSSYDRFVNRFGETQLQLIWADSLQLLAAYLGAFVVQIYFAHRIHRLTKGRPKFSISAFGLYIIFAFAFVSIVAGVVQTATSYHLRSYLKLDQTKAITTVQAASSLACDGLITVYLWIFLSRQKGEFMRTNSLMDSLIHDAITRGLLTAVSSLANMVLFLAIPNSFWFFLGLAPSSKLYMNSMLATLNGRQSRRDKLDSTDKGWHTFPMATIPAGGVGVNSHISGVHVHVQVESDKIHDRPLEFDSNSVKVDMGAGGDLKGREFV